MQVIPLHLPPGDPATERKLQIDGTPEQIEAAKLMVNEVISEVCSFMQEYQVVSHCLVYNINSIRIRYQLSFFAISLSL